ncbi:hypothetical protein OW731_12850 [Avibacterium paragallinarum]|uniref:hypothetical protein n=1 Tax=Avibacterium paragallinarum TaxID=728 RepID=UPI0022859C94|nr:hypothetical protein [Avibacterium paragallinarum]WAM59350.1 hypothetical protein OW731_12850 [Avibacterium paragallinarum]
MKKTLLALAVAAVATSASAATVYSNESTQVGVGGYFDVVLGKFGKDQRTDLRNNESRINFTAQQDLGDGLWYCELQSHYTVVLLLFMRKRSRFQSNVQRKLMTNF